MMNVRIISLLLFLNSSLWAQATVESIPKLRYTALRLEDSIRYLFDNFCSINAENEKNGDKVLELATFNLIDKMYSHGFYLFHFECMSEEQKRKVARFLRVYLLKDGLL